MHSRGSFCDAGDAPKRSVQHTRAPWVLRALAEVTRVSVGGMGKHVEQGKGAVERAFELAQDGSCSTIELIRRRLKSEGYSSVAEHIGGPAIVRQLKAALLLT